MYSCSRIWCVARLKKKKKKKKKKGKIHPFDELSFQLKFMILMDELYKTCLCTRLDENEIYIIQWPE